MAAFQDSLVYKRGGQELLSIIPSYGVMQALDQVRSLSDSVQKLANDTVLALGNIKDTLASHKMMILQNRVALDYILATQGGACTIIGPECCTGLMDPTENLNKIQQDILSLSAKLHQMTEDNSSWFGNLLGKPGCDQGKSNSALVSPTCVLSMHPEYQVFLTANDSRLSRGNDSSNQKEIITRKNFMDPNCMFCFCVSMQLHISNAEHVQCACNDYKLQELTFKCLICILWELLETLKGGELWDYKFYFKCLI